MSIRVLNWFMAMLPRIKAENELAAHQVHLMAAGNAEQSDQSKWFRVRKQIATGHDVAVQKPKTIEDVQLAAQAHGITFIMEEAS